MIVIKTLVALVTALSLLSAAFGCGQRLANDRLYRHGRYGYTVVVPSGWSLQEEDNGAVRIEAPGPKDANGQAATIYIMVVDPPERWSWSKDVDDLSNQFSNYTFIGKGTQERAGAVHCWVSFACDQGAARHKNLNCTISAGKKIITLTCFADENRFPELETTFKNCVFSIDPGTVGQD
jgi:hypothetical protein